MPNYLYNGVELPAIPAEVMSNPYVYIFESVEGSTYLAYGFDTKPTTVSVTTFGNSVDKLRVESGTYASACWYSTTPDEWTGIEANKSPSDAALGYMQQNLSDVIWANFDVYLSNGELFLAASEPIPVTEPESFDLDSWLIGFAMGLANEPLPLGIAAAYVYDDIWPIQWNIGEILNNKKIAIDEQIQLIKISNYVLTADDMAVSALSQFEPVAVRDLLVWNDDSAMSLAYASNCGTIVYNISSPDAELEEMGMSTGLWMLSPIESTLGEAELEQWKSYSYILGYNFYYNTPMNFNSAEAISHEKRANFSTESSIDFHKISDLVLNQEQLSKLYVNIQLPDSDVYAAFSAFATETYEKANIKIYTNDDNTVGFYLCSCTDVGDYTDMTVSVPETGLYYAIISFTDGTDLSGQDINIEIRSLADLPEDTGRIVAADSITENSITHTIVEDSDVTLLKISDAIMSIDEIKNSSIVSTRSDNTVSVIHTIGNYLSTNPTYAKTMQLNGVNIYREIYSYILSVSDTAAAGEVLEADAFPSTGTYVKVPKSGSMEYILRCGNRVYNGVEAFAHYDIYNMYGITLEEYRYVYLTKDSRGYYYLYLTNAIAKWDSVNSELITSDACTDMEFFSATPADDTYWYYSQPHTHTAAGETITDNELVWCNHDVVDADGNVILAATEPQMPTTTTTTEQEVSE